MAEKFLNPPQGPTSLRAPQLNEGADVLGNAAGNDPGMLGKIAQMLLKLREPVGLATMGMGGGASQAGMPPAGRNPLMREAIYNTGLNVRPPGGLPPSQETLNAQRVNVGKDALTGFLQELANMKRGADIAEARIPYPGGADWMPAPPASSFGKPGSIPTVPQAVPPMRSESAPNPQRMRRPQDSPSTQASVAGRRFDPSAAILTNEEIQAIFKSMQPTVQTSGEIKPPSTPRQLRRHDPKIGRSVVDKKKEEK